MVSSDGLEHSVDIGKVVGSNPMPPTTGKICQATAISIEKPLSLSAKYLNKLTIAYPKKISRLFRK
ncbi:protein of unknown function [Cardinium endosymbiont cEper1 of Encarsia pergandiella]|nr:protein of unknown function [Cardinium endosymbiont cEper1 of Encarsia pergandiella]